MENFIDVTPEAGKALFMQNPKGELIMLNLLRFKDVADYSAFPDLLPDTPISGKDAYDLYIEHTLPILREYGGDVIYSGTGSEYLIGPADQKWDLVLLVRHKSLQVFMSFAQNEAYLKGAGHRTAALLDSRLLPTQELKTR